MPTSLGAPFTSPFAVTLRVAGSMVAIHLPSTSPMIEPACTLVEAVTEAATTPNRASSFGFGSMDISILQGGNAGRASPGFHGRSYEPRFAELQESARPRVRDGHVVVSLTCVGVDPHGLIVHGYAASARDGW